MIPLKMPERGSLGFRRPSWSREEVKHEVPPLRPIADMAGHGRIAPCGSGDSLLWRLSDGPNRWTRVAMGVFHSGIARGTAIALSVVASCFLAGCYTPPKAFHQAAIQPKGNLWLDPKCEEDGGFCLPHDAYVIGVEKDNASRIGRVRECESADDDAQCLHAEASYYRANPDLLAELRTRYKKQIRPTYVSHILRYDRIGFRDGCSVYNSRSSARLCEGAAPAQITGATALQTGWREMLFLENEIRRRVSELLPTHFVVYMMGWNTSQDRAFSDARKMFANLESASRKFGGPKTSFRPLYFLITWPSTGDPTIPYFDFPIKAKDADEVGAIWGNVLINRVLVNIKKDTGIPVVAVGHSFGARGLARAITSAPLLGVSESPDSDAGERERRGVDLFVGLQGAFSSSRLVPAQAAKNTKDDDADAAPYRDFGKHVRAFVLTAATDDRVVTIAGRGPFFVGSIGAYEKTKVEWSGLFLHREARSDGTMAEHVCPPRGKILYVNASAFVNDKNAHGDILDPEMGRFVFERIRECKDSAIRR
jgi:hypothetical protein